MLGICTEFNNVPVHVVGIFSFFFFFFFLFLSSITLFRGDKGGGVENAIYY